MASSLRDVMKNTPFPNLIKEDPKPALEETCTQYSLPASLRMEAEETLLLVILENSLMKTGMGKSTRTENCKLMNRL
jgi:hypothetical protein